MRMPSTSVLLGTSRVLTTAFLVSVPPEQSGQSHGRDSPLGSAYTYVPLSKSVPLSLNFHIYRMG